MTTPEEKEHAEIQSRLHCIFCGRSTLDRCLMCGRGMCKGCQPEEPCGDCEWEEYLRTSRTRLAAHMAAVVTRAKQGTIALGLVLSALSMAHAEGNAYAAAYADAYPLIPTDGECAITHTWEDGSATALCGTDVWAYDADGGYIVDNGIKYFYRAEGTWYQVS